MSIENEEGRAPEAAPPSEQPPAPQPAAEPAPEVEAQPTPDDAAAPAEAAPTGTKVPVSMLGRAIAELQEQQKGHHDRLLRMAADYDNYKKRSRKEQSEAVKRAEEKTVQEFLPVVDNLERALSHSEAGSSLLEGVRMVHKQVLSVLDRFGIKPFESVGQPFDPERHEAIQQAASELPPGTICQEAQRGYARGDRLVRPAMVVVSLGPVSVEASKTSEDGEAPSMQEGGEPGTSGES